MLDETLWRQLQMDDAIIGHVSDTQNCTWTVYLDGSLIGKLTDISPDWPWHHGKFDPTPLFAEIEETFINCEQEKNQGEHERIMDKILNRDIKIVADDGGVFSSRLNESNAGYIARFYINKGRFRLRLMIGYKGPAIR